MNRTVSYLIPAVLTLSAAAQPVTPAEKEHALTYLAQTRDGLVAATKGLSEAQLKFKPSPDRWSVAEVMEHLALIEDLINQGIFTRLPTAPAPAAGWDAAQVDAMVLAKMTDRSTKAKAPEPAVPTGRWAPAESLEHFLAARAQTVTFLKSTPDLRAHVVSHPVFGPMDGYEWILAVASHTERHTKQILEVKADAGYPTH